MRKGLIVIAAAPIALLAACNQAAAPADPAAVLAEIQKVEEGQIAAFNADDADGATAVYAADARFFDAGSPVVVGSDAIKAAFGAMLGDANAALELTENGSWVAASGELAVTSADYKQTMTGVDGKPTTIAGANLTVWQKQADGSWKIAADFNGPAPAAEAAAAEEAPAAE